jgi:hypothetical protein
MSVAILTRSKAIEIGIRSAIEFFYFDDIALMRGATCFHRFAVVLVVLKTAKRWQQVATGVSLWDRADQKRSRERGDRNRTIPAPNSSEKLGMNSGRIFIGKNNIIILQRIIRLLKF